MMENFQMACFMDMVPTILKKVKKHMWGVLKTEKLKVRDI